MTDKTTQKSALTSTSLNEDHINQNKSKNGIILTNQPSIQNTDSLYRMDKYKKRSDSPNFLIKLYQILESPEYEKIIHWSDDGKSFIVHNLHDFTEYVLPKYFKHNNYSSFIRQLNMYDFHKQKSNNTEAIFQHPHFLKNDKDSLKLIKRKNKKDNLISQPINGLVPFNNGNIINEFSALNPNNFNINYNNNSLIEYNQRSNFLPSGNINNNNNLAMPISVLNLNNLNKQDDIPNANINNNNKKKITKKSLQKLLLYLMKNVEQNTEKQKYLEKKIDTLTKKNEEFILQNQQMLNEIISKSEYNNKLEAVVRFILGLIMNNTPKKKNNSDLKNILTDNNNKLHDNHNIDLDKIGYVNIPPTPHEIKSIIPSNDFLQNNGYNDSFQVFINKYMDHAKNTCLLTNNKENNNQYLIDNNINNNNSNLQNNNQNILVDSNNSKKRSDSIDSNDSKNQKSELPLSPIFTHKKRNRTASFNTILSNGSNNMSYEDFLRTKNIGKNDCMSLPPLNDIDRNSVNDLVLNGNNDMNNLNGNNLNDSNSNKNFFDIDLNSVNGNKDSLNNSQISFNDLYNNPSNIDKDSDIFYDGNI